MYGIVRSYVLFFLSAENLTAWDFNSSAVHVCMHEALHITEKAQPIIHTHKNDRRSPKTSRKQCLWRGKKIVG